MRKKITRPPVPAESRLSKISIKSSTPPKCENIQRKSVEVNITNIFTLIAELKNLLLIYSFIFFKILNSDKEDLTTSSSTMELSQSQSMRLSGTGIPKPVATVKGMAKPTHSVAPMQQINSESKKNDDLKEKNIVKPLDTCNEIKKPENVSLRRSVSRIV